MDINHIDLPPFTVSELYRNTLVDTSVLRQAEVKDATENTGEKKAYKYLGNNEKNILVLVNNTNAVYLPDNELSFFTSIIGACKLSLADLAILNLHHYPQTGYKELMDFFHSRVIFLLGVEPSAIQLPVNFPHYQLQAFAGNTFLYTPPLQAIENDRQEKTNLWTCLKRLFNL